MAGGHDTSQVGAPSSQTQSGSESDERGLGALRRLWALSRAQPQSVLFLSVAIVALASSLIAVSEVSIYEEVICCRHSPDRCHDKKFCRTDDVHNELLHFMYSRLAVSHALAGIFAVSLWRFTWDRRFAYLQERQDRRAGERVQPDADLQIQEPENTTPGLKQALITTQFGSWVIEIVKVMIARQCVSKNSDLTDWILATPFLSAVLGGGPMMYMVLLDKCLAGERSGDRATLFALLQALSAVCMAVGYHLIKPITDHNGAWACLWIGLFVWAVGIVPLCFLRITAPSTADPPPLGEQQSPPLGPRVLLLTVAGSMAKSLLVTSTTAPFAVTYMSHRFDIENSSTAHILAIRTWISVLALLLSSFYAQSDGRSIARTAALFTCIALLGSMTLAFTTSPTLFAAAICVTSAGYPFMALMKSLMANWSTITFYMVIFSLESIVEAFFRIMANVGLDWFSQWQEEVGFPGLAYVLVTLACLLLLLVLLPGKYIGIRTISDSQGENLPDGSSVGNAAYQGNDGQGSHNQGSHDSTDPTHRGQSTERTPLLDSRTA